MQCIAGYTEHIRYRKNLGHTVEGLVTLCVQYEMYLD